jgi:hypothetical protein
MSGARRKSHWLQLVTQFPVHIVTEVKSVNGFKCVNRRRCQLLRVCVFGDGRMNK